VTDERKKPVEQIQAEQTSERTCVGCGKRMPAESLVRVVLAETPDQKASSVVCDAKGGSFGRGAHVHASPECLVNACKKGLPRAFKREIKMTPLELAQSIAAAHGRRLAGLLAGGVRAGLVAIGNDAVIEALRSGRSKLVVLAADAAAAASRDEVRMAVGEGKSVVFGDRMKLAEAVGRVGAQAREGVAIVAITDHALAGEVRRAWLCVQGVGETSVGRNAG
jgi:predicted RNA-binding protein YlxR (DUF448 family)/ribosomal protein L7Ae-like RNA K-turn-binding protein